MRTFRSLKARGFTLVELMIVVAIIGVLAALAIFGVRKYLTAAKTAEARNTIGAISRASVAAYERENIPGQLLTGGNSSAQGSHSLCGSSTAVPSDGPPKGKKYQPKTGTTEDFNGGDSTAGWKCLRFSMTEPHYYQYAYTNGNAAKIATGVTVTGGGTVGWLSEAVGDLNGDGVNGSIVGVGGIDNGQPKIGTQLIETNADE